MRLTDRVRRILSMLLVLVMIVSLVPVSASAAGADETLMASLEKAEKYIDGITINNSSNDPATVVKNFKTHFTWDNEKRENSKSYLFDWSYYNGVVFEGIEYVYEVTGESVYKDYVMEYMSSLIASNGTWATCSNNSSKQCAGYNSTHGADCYKTASLLLDAYEMSGDSRYLTMAKTLYTDLTNAAKSYSLSKAGNNFRHTWASDPSPDLWLDGLYMILPFRAEYAKYIGDTAELNLIVSRMQWVSDNMYNSSKGLFYHAADSATSNSNTFWLRSIGWYAAAIVDIMDSMSGSNLEAMKAQLKKLVDGMKACQNASNGMWLNNMAASKSTSNPYETSGTALTCYAVMKAVNNGWLDESYADMAILAFNGICNEKLSGSNLKDICFKGAPGSSNSTFYDNEGKGLGPFIMFYAEMLEYVNNNSCDHDYESVTVDATCTKEGSATYTCTLCGDSYAETIPATGEHSYESVTVDATCTKPGSVTTTCAVCGDTSAEEIAALGHDYACVVTEATCSKAGSKVYTCTRCADTYSEVIPATGAHDYAYVSEVATCTEPGTATGTCTVCGKVVVEKVESLGHDYACAVTEATCSKDGQKVYTCTRCDDTYTEVIPATGKHTYKTVTVDATCAEDGATTHTCAVCGDAYTEVIPATGKHTYTSKTVDATVTEDGAVIYTCTVCGHSYSEVIPAIGETTYTLTEKTGTVDRYAAASAYTGAQLIIANNHGTNYVDVTVGMLTDGNGKAVSTSAANMLTGLKVVYNGQTVATGFVLEVLETDGNWVALPKGYTYTLDTNGMDVGSDNKYLIVGSNSNYAMTLSGSTIGAAKVTIENNQITLEDPAQYEFYFVSNNSKERNTYLLTRDGSKSVYHMGGNMYYGTDNKGYWYVTSNSNGTYKVYDYDNLNWYLNYGYVWASDSVSRFAVSSTNTRTVRLFKLSGSGYDGYARLSGATRQAYCAEDGATLASVLNKITVQTGSDGVNVGKEIALTADMVSWDAAFNGGVVGTYTGTVTYGEQVLGTIVVSITHEHDSETVTKDATCTENGSVTTTCTICGETTVETIPAIGKHTNETTTVDATCTAEGSVTTTCTVCGETSVEKTAALGHNYACVVTEATCAQDGAKVYTCSRCDDSYSETIPATGVHTYETVTVEPTCTETGAVIHTCSVCADSYTDVIASLGHDYTSTVTAATCTEDGYTTYTCETCGHAYTADQIAALGHAYETAVTATCTEDGFVVYTCTTCGHSYNGEEVKAYGHDYTETVVAPTCGKDGYTTFVCAVCGHSYTGNIVTAPGHAYGADVTEATCTEGGYTTFTCTACGDSYVSDYTAALGHAYHSVVTEPTFEEMGYTTHTCTACGDVVVDSFVPVKTHTYETETVAATCTEDGYIAYTCVECGYSYTETIAAFGHSYEVVTKDPTCEQDGAIVSTCVTCGHKDVEVLEALGHDFEIVVIDPTCETDGYTTYTCACGHVTTDVVSALGHAFQTKTTAPTCTENGAVVDTCTVCGHEETEVIVALGHNYASQSTAPTCTKEGYTTYTCGTCGDSYISDKVAALGHNNTSVVTAPTCTADGYTTYTCTVCGASHTGDKTAALGHSYTTKEQNGYLVYTCGTCGDSYSEKVEMTYTKVSSLSSGNAYVITLKSGTKYYALSHKNNKISAVQVTMSNNKITSEVTEDLVWNFSSNKLSYVSGDKTYYLYASTSGWWGTTTTLSISTSNSSTVSFSSSKLKVGSKYLRYSYGGISLSSSSTTTYAFLEE